MKNCSHIPFQLTAQICESSKILKSSVYRAKQFKTWFEYLKLSGTNIFRIPLFGGKLFFSSLIYPSSLRVCVCVLVTHSHSVTHQDPLSMDFSRQEYWVGCHSLLQRIFLTEGSNPGLLHCRQILYPLSHDRSPLSQGSHISETLGPCATGKVI